MNTKDKIKAIYEKIWPTRFGWNEYWEFEFVMIWDVLDYMEKNKDELFFQWDMDIQNFVSYYWESIKIFIDIWQEKRKSLEEQSDDCIECIYNLIK